ncbi:MAG: hypothetical protein JHD16_00040 [Solirubrobacteraceae bacterium]|nr:hypothetical protein [Solirubrobacteraceae bacterium]
MRHTISLPAHLLDATCALDATVDWESLFDEAERANAQEVANAVRQLAEPARNRWWRTRYAPIIVHATVVHPVQYRAAAQPGGKRVALVRCPPTTGRAGVPGPEGTTIGELAMGEPDDPAAWWAWLLNALGELERDANAGYHAQLAAGRTPATRRQLLQRAAAQHAQAKRR